MARDPSRVWYEAMRALGVEPGVEPLSEDEARAEYEASPADPGSVARGSRGDASGRGPAPGRRGRRPPSRRPSSRRPSSRRSAARIRRRQVTPGPVALATALAFAFAVVLALAWHLGSGGDEGSPAETGASETMAAGPADAGGPEGGAASIETAAQDAGEAEREGASRARFAPGPPQPMVAHGRFLQLADFERRPDGSFAIEGRTVSREDAEAWFARLESPYHVASEHILLLTNGGIDLGDRMLDVAEAAYRRAREFFGKAPRLGGDERMCVYLAAGVADYNELGAAWGGDEKSSAFYAFCTPSMVDKGGAYADVMPASVTLFSRAESLAEVYVTHAVAEQFVRRLALEAPPGERPPRWFIDGVASYLARWSRPALWTWSRDRLAALGGAGEPGLPFEDYFPDEGRILSAGAWIAYLKSDRCPPDWSSLLQLAVVSVNEGRGVREAFRELQGAIAAAGTAPLREYLDR